jgi:hypothetical protein
MIIVQPAYGSGSVGGRALGVIPPSDPNLPGSVVVDTLGGSDYLDLIYGGTTPPDGGRYIGGWMNVHGSAILVFAR